MTITQQRFAASPDVVWAALIAADRYPEWLVGAKVVRVTDPMWPRPGSSFDHKVGAGPIEVSDHTTVSGIEPGRTLDLIVRARPFIEADVRFRVTPDGTGTMLSMNERPRGPFKLAAPLLAPLIKARNARSLQQLEKLLD